MKPYFLLITAFLFLVLSSCDKKKKGTFTIKGRRVKDCSGKAIWSGAITAYENIKFGYPAQPIGTGGTDSNGYFEFVCDYYSSTPKKVRGLSSVFETPNNIRIGDVIDLGTIYDKFSASVVVKIDILSNSYNNDTLFIKDMYSSSNIDTIYPILQGNVYYTYTNYSGIAGGGWKKDEENNSSKLNYSIGIADINISKENTVYHINYCGISKDTVVITLP